MSRGTVPEYGAGVPGAGTVYCKCSPRVEYIITPARPRSHAPPKGGCEAV